MGLRGRNYKPGSIWFIERYNFGTEHDTRDKYCIILKVDPDSEQVCFCLATRRRRYPVSNSPGFGCNNGNNGFYFFPKNAVIGKEAGFAFCSPTHTYHGFDFYLEHYSKLEVYDIDERVTLLDVMQPIAFENFYQCLATGHATRRKIKRFL